MAPPAESGPKNMHGFMSFGIGSMALMLGTAFVGISSVVPHMGLGRTAFAVSKAIATFLPLLLAAWGFWHGVRAFVLARRGIPCYKESDFAAFLGLVLSVVVAGMFVYFGILSPSAVVPR